MPSLVIEYPESLAGRTFPLTGPPVVVGRGADCGIRIKSETLSRHHVRIHDNGDDWVVEDLKSTNGSSLDNVAFERAVLRDGDRLKVGTVILKFQLADPTSLPGDSDDGESGAPAELTVRLPRRN